MVPFVPKLDIFRTGLSEVVRVSRDMKTAIIKAVRKQHVLERVQSPGTTIL